MRSKAALAAVFVALALAATCPITMGKSPKGSPKTKCTPKMANYPTCGAVAQACKDTTWTIQDEDDIPEDNSFRDCKELKSVVVEWDHDEEFDCSSCFEKLEKIGGNLTLGSGAGSKAPAARLVTAWGGLACRLWHR